MVSTEVMIAGLRLLCPLCALWGLSLFLQRRMKISPCLAPALACAWVALLVTLGGALGLLLPSTVVLWAGGILLLIYEGWERRKRWKAFLCAPVFFLLLCYLYGAIRLNGVRFLHYDNFSHWALVADHLLRADRLPQLGDALITFPSYPTASACFVYFFAKPLGGGEGAMAFGQAVWIFGSAATLLTFVKERKPLAYGLIAINLAAMLSANIFLDELLVDTLLPMAGLAAVAAALTLQNAPKKAAWVMLPLCVVLPLIKSSGMFFALIAMGLYAFLLYRRDHKAGLRALAVLLAGLAAAMLLWRLHVSLAFGSEGGKHAVDGAAYAASFSGKLSSGVLWQCSKNFLKRLCEPWAVQNQLFFVMALGLALLWLAGPKPKAARNMLGLVIGLWALWQLGILGMYAFSASEREALNLSGQQRYSLSMGEYLLGLCTLFLIHLLNQPWEGNAKKRTLCLCLCGFLAISPLWPLKNNLPCLWRGLNPSTQRAELEAQLAENDVPLGRRYTLYVKDYTQASYLMYLGRYLLQSPQVNVVDGDDYQSALPSALESSDYLIFTQPNPQALSYAEGLLINSEYAVQVVEYRP